MNKASSLSHNKAQQVLASLMANGSRGNSSMFAKVTGILFSALLVVYLTRQAIPAEVVRVFVDEWIGYIVFLLFTIQNVIEGLNTNEETSN